MMEPSVSLDHLTLGFFRDHSSNTLTALILQYLYFIQTIATGLFKDGLKVYLSKR